MASAFARPTFSGPEPFPLSPTPTGVPRPEGRRLPPRSMLRLEPCFCSRQTIMTNAFPHHYEVQLQLDDVEHAEGTLTTHDGPAARIGPPVQFGGRAGHQSPEDLLLAALAGCHMTTLVALIRRKGLRLHEYRATASGTLEKTRDGLRFTSIRLRVEARTDPGQELEMERLIEAAEGYCIISGALKLTVELEKAVSSGSP